MNRLLILICIIGVIGCTPLKKTSGLETGNVIPEKKEMVLVSPLPSLMINDPIEKPAYQPPSKDELIASINEKRYHIPPVFYPVAQPFLKMRNDSWGDGHFGASRGRRQHNGLDIIVAENSAVYCPIEGIVTRKAYPYGSTGRNAKWEGIVIKGTNLYKGYEVKIFYMIPFLMGEQVYPNDIIGKAQAISKKYSSNMIDHLHVEVRYHGVLRDPATLFNLVK